MNAPLVSIYMVVRNVERFLCEAIESILGQTFRDFEFIIVDFGSSDKSRSIALGYAAKDRRIRLEDIASCGLATARNRACAFAKGKYIAVMDADDVSSPDRIALEVEFMEAHPEVAVLGGVAEAINAEGASLSVRLHSCPAEDREIRVALTAGCPFCHSTLLIRREAFEAVGGYREALTPAEDYDLLLRIAESGRCAGLQQVVLKYRLHPYQLSIQKLKQQTFGRVAAQSAAARRLTGAPDPLCEVTEITPTVLTDLGVSEAEQQEALASDCWNWIRHMKAAGARSAALAAAVEILQADLHYVERRRISDFYVLTAELYWRERRFCSGIFALGCAVLVRPTVAARPLKRLVQVGLAKAGNQLVFRSQS